MAETNIVTLLMRLEKRVMALENAMGIITDSANYLHPKAYSQYQEAVKTTDVGWIGNLREYIYAHYDLDVLVFLIIIYINQNTPVEIKQMVASVGRWLMSVLAYYFAMRKQFNTTGEWVNPDYRQFDATDPKISLKTIIAAMMP